MDSRLSDLFHIESEEDLLNLEIDEKLLSRIDITFFIHRSIIPISLDDKCIYCISFQDISLNFISDIRLLTELSPIVIQIDSDIYSQILNKIKEKVAVLPQKVDVFKLDSSEEVQDLNELKKIVKYLNELIEDAIVARASDIHIETFSNYISIRFRVDGRLNEVVRLNRELHSIIVTRIKILANMDIAERRLPQDGRISFKYEDREIDMRLSTLPTIHGEKIVIRLLDNSDAMKSLWDLGMRGNNLEMVQSFINEPYGLVLFCGPTGVGKSSSIYSILQLLNSDEVNIISIEDPVEYKIDGVNQIQVHYKIGLNFERVLENILRSDPDIIFIGELRSEDTAEVAMRSAITGHLIFSTLHTSNAIGGIYRLMDLGVEKYMINNGLIGVVSQRLVRLLCPHCKSARTDYIDFVNCEMKHYEAVGCSHCNKGYRGRMGIFEVLTIDNSIRRKISENCDYEDILKEAIKSGFVPISDQAVQLFTEGLIDRIEVETVLSSLNR